jgi:hypothetical protein
MRQVLRPAPPLSTRQACPGSEGGLFRLTAYQQVGTLLTQYGERLGQVDEPGDSCGFGLEAIASGKLAQSPPERSAPERVGGREETKP